MTTYLDFNEKKCTKSFTTVSRAIMPANELIELALTHGFGGLI